MPTILEIDARADVAAAAGDLSSLGSEARNLGGDLDSAGSAARTAGTDLSGLGDGADNVASKSSQATGALGALAGGLEAVGLEQYAAGLQAAAIGTDVMSGAGDALNLVAETAAGKWIVTTAQTVAHTVATGAQTVATGTMTAAQGALNAVMALNPIALVVIAVVALVAALVLAYRNSETFRNIVDGAFTRAREVVAGAVEVVSDFVDWLKDLPGQAGKAWTAVADAVEDATGDAIGFVTGLYDDVTGGIDTVRDTVSAGFSAAFQPIQTAIGWVQDLIDKIGSIDFPDFPDFPFRATGDGTGKEELLAQQSSDRAVLSIALTAAPTDKEAATRALIDGLRDYFARQGLTLSLTTEGTR